MNMIQSMKVNFSGQLFFGCFTVEMFIVKELYVYEGVHCSYKKMLT